MERKTKEHILVIGAFGFVGRALVQELLRSKISTQEIVLLSRAKQEGISGTKIVTGDLLDQKFLSGILKEIDTVYYLAAYKKNISIHIGASFDTLAKNVRPFLHFLEAAKESNVSKIIYVSSINATYAEGEERIDGYVYGKYINELIARSFAAETGIAIKVIRSSAVYGVGDNFDPATANFIPALIEKIDSAKEEIVVWGRGVRKLQFIYVDDLVKNILAAARSRENFFVFGNPEVVSVNAVVKKLLKIFGKKLTIVHDTTKPDKKTKLSTFANLVSPKVSIDAGLKEAVSYYHTHHDK